MWITLCQLNTTHVIKISVLGECHNHELIFTNALIKYLMTYFVILSAKLVLKLDLML